MRSGEVALGVRPKGDRKEFIQHNRCAALLCRSSQPFPTTLPSKWSLVTGHPYFTAQDTKWE